MTMASVFEATAQPLQPQRHSDDQFSIVDEIRIAGRRFTIEMQARGGHFSRRMAYYLALLCRTTEGRQRLER